MLYEETKTDEKKDNADRLPGSQSSVLDKTFGFFKYFAQLEIKSE